MPKSHELNIPWSRSVSLEVSRMTFGPLVNNLHTEKKHEERFHQPNEPDAACSPGRELSSDRKNTVLQF